MGERLCLLVYQEGSWCLNEHATFPVDQLVRYAGNERNGMPKPSKAGGGGPSRRSTIIISGQFITTKPPRSPQMVVKSKGITPKMALN